MGKPGKKAGNSMAPPTKTTRQVPAGQTHLRDQRTIKRLKMYNSKVVRNEKGEITKGSVLSAADRVTQQMARIAPDRRWFGNSRVIGQHALQEFRKEMGEKYRDPYSVVVKQAKLPLSLLEEPKNAAKLAAPQREMHFQATFGDKASRKRVRLAALNVTDLAATAAKKEEKYDSVGDKKDRDKRRAAENAGTLEVTRVDRHTSNRSLFKKGQSNRIWNELHKVIDSSDVVMYVVDVRDPMGTRSRYVEEFMRTEKKYKHFVFVLNKCDLVPLWVTARWLQILSTDFPTVAFHASVNHPFGKGNLISLLRQFSRLHNVAQRGKKKAPISVGIVGYPNVGKSSVINTLRRKACCKTAPIPGETKIWQYVALTKSIFLIDCPGIVYDREGNEDIQAVLKGVVRIERLGAQDKSDVVHAAMERVHRRDIVATYGVDDYTDSNDFLEKLAKKRGKLLGGGVPDVDQAARAVLYDWQRGKLPWFEPPPFNSEAEAAAAKAKSDAEHAKEIDRMNELSLVGDAIAIGVTPDAADMVSSDDEDAPPAGAGASADAAKARRLKEKAAVRERNKETAMNLVGLAPGVDAPKAPAKKKAPRPGTAGAGKKEHVPASAAVKKVAAKQDEEAALWDRFLGASA